jgi:hypothetical protein
MAHSEIPRRTTETIEALKETFWKSVKEEILLKLFVVVLEKESIMQDKKRPINTKAYNTKDVRRYKDKIQKTNAITQRKIRRFPSFPDNTGMYLYIRTDKGIAKAMQILKAMLL